MSKPNAWLTQPRIDRSHLPNIDYKAKTEDRKCEIKISTRAAKNEILSLYFSGKEKSNEILSAITKGLNLDPYGDIRILSESTTIAFDSESYNEQKKQGLKLVLHQSISDIAESNDTLMVAYESELNNDYTIPTRTRNSSIYIQSNKGDHRLFFNQNDPPSTILNAIKKEFNISSNEEILFSAAGRAIFFDRESHEDRGIPEPLKIFVNSLNDLTNTKASTFMLHIKQKDNFQPAAGESGLSIQSLSNRFANSSLTEAPSINWEQATPDRNLKISFLFEHTSENGIVWNNPFTFYINGNESTDQIIGEIRKKLKIEANLGIMILADADLVAAESNISDKFNSPDLLKANALCFQEAIQNAGGSSNLVVATLSQ